MARGFSRVLILHFIGTANKPAADGIINLMQDCLTRRIIGVELHAIGMVRQDHVIIKDQVSFRVKAHFAQLVMMQVFFRHQRSFIFSNFCRV